MSIHKIVASGRTPQGPTSLSVSTRLSQRDAGATRERLDAAGARAITERIKQMAHAISLLLLEAHEGQAWVALGYGTWEEYVRQEFDLSRPRSYELLAHGRLVRSVEEITGVHAVADIAPYTARRLKPRVGEFLDALRRRASDTPTDAMPAVVGEVLDAYLPSGSRSHAEPKLAEAVNSVSEGTSIPVQSLERGIELFGQGAIDVTKLREVLDYLARLPSALDVVEEVDRSAPEFVSVESALRWLSEFAREWHARRADG